MSRSERLLRILLDNQLAQLGDCFVNLLYSLALTRRYNKPTGKRISDKALAEAAQLAGIRQLLPKRTKRGNVANSIEALLVHVWLNRLMTIDEMTTILKSTQPDPKAFAEVTKIALQKLDSS